MRLRALVLALLVVTTPAWAGERQLQDRTPMGLEFSITLTEEPCELQVDTTGLDEQMAKTLRKAKILVEGAPIRACYVEDGVGIFGADELGNLFGYPKERFRDMSI